MLYFSDDLIPQPVAGRRVLVHLPSGSFYPVLLQLLLARLNEFELCYSDLCFLALHLLLPLLLCVCVSALSKCQGCVSLDGFALAPPQLDSRLVYSAVAEFVRPFQRDSL